MSESLKEVWDASAAQPFQPIVSKNWQFLVGFSLLAWAFLLTGIFALNRCIITLPLLGLPASLAFGFGSVFMICAAGVYSGPAFRTIFTLMAVFTAASSSVRPLFILLRCVGFASKADVEITHEGIRFSVEEARVMQGLAFLDKSLFTTFHFSPAQDTATTTTDSTPNLLLPHFQISLPAMLETLQIFGLPDITSKDRSSRETTYTSYANDLAASRNNAFDSRTLGMAGLCRLHYEGEGHPLCITLEEGQLKTTCKLVTYEPELPLDTEDTETDIPFNRDVLALKIILRASSLHSALAELASTSPDTLTLSAMPNVPSSSSSSSSSSAPAAFTLSSTGTLGSASIDFASSSQLLETYQVPRPTSNRYKFELFKKAARAMAAAAKVSIRLDKAGVLSLQFMVELSANAEGSGGDNIGEAEVGFVDFRFVPLLDDESGDEGSESDE